MRIIPARAGFTGSSSPIPGSTWDHPRSRGVYLYVEDGEARLAGSSPLARGLPRGLELDGEGRGIIPARAGFTAKKDPKKSTDPDHPRSRGVYDAVLP